jgi:hypothetical protein
MSAFATCSAHSRAEVPIVGRTPRSGQPPGRGPGGSARRAGGVLIADYKTIARHLADRNASGYVKQLALYRAVLRLIYRTGRSDRPDMDRCA